MPVSFLFSIFVVAIYCLACFGVGQLMMIAIQERHYKTIPNYAFFVSAFILGQTGLAIIWTLIGLVGLLNIIAVSITTSIGVILFFVCNKVYIKLIPYLIKSEWQWLVRTEILFRVICISILTLLLLFFLTAALTGPLGDAEAFYMTYAKVISASSKLTEMPGGYRNFSQIGLLAELHFAALMILGVAEASKLFVWPIAISAGLMLTVICTQVRIGKKGQWVAFILLFTSTGFTNHIWDGKVDVFSVALGLAAIYWIMLEEKVSKTSLRLIGFFSGFAMAAKFSYIPIIIPSFFLLLSWRLYVSDVGMFNFNTYIKKLAMQSLTVCIWVLLAWTPHLLKNWILFNAPLAPFIGDNSSLLNQAWFSAKDTAWIIKTYPLALIFGRYPMQGGNLSLLWLAFLPFIFFSPRAKSFVRSPLTQITVTGIVGVCVWVLLRPSVLAPRYIFISLALLIPMVAWGVEQIYEEEERPYLLRIAILITILFAVLFVSYPHIKNTGLKAIRNSDIQDQCALSGEYCGSFNKLNSIAHLGARMYFAGYYGYWARADMLQCQLSLAEMQFLYNIKDKNDKWKYLIERGVNYVVIDRSSHAQKALEFGSTPTPSWLSRELIVDDQKLMVWKIQSSDAKRLAKVECNANEAKSWKLYEKNEEVSD